MEPGLELTPDQREENQENQAMEIEALESTLDQLELSTSPLTITIYLENTRHTLLHEKLPFLPPLKLTISLPPSYPSHSPPQIEVNSTFNFMKEQIISHLLERWSEDELVLYDWYDYLKSEFFDEIESIDFQPEEGEKEQDFKKKMKEQTNQTLKFFLETQEKLCSICYEEKRGMVILQSCSHYFCKDCLVEHLNISINSKDIDNISCPQCRASLYESELKSLLKESELEKYYKFTLDSALEKMQDVEWCPNCQKPVVISLNVGFCDSCTFKFCLACKEAQHLGKRCSTVKANSDQMRNLNEEQKKEYIKQNETSLYIQKYVKNCPNCKWGISKISGCNKVVCSKCSSYFCWICNLDISDIGYQHFEDSTNPCTTYTYGKEAHVDHKELTNTDKDKIMEDLGAVYHNYNTVQCQTCQFILMKTDEMNQIHCNKCQTDVCFLCGQTISEYHYLSSTCRKISPLKEFKDAEETPVKKKEEIYTNDPLTLFS